MPDEQNEKLRCPGCGKTGTASLSQGDGDAYRPERREWL
jgi:hypothetical protein